MLKEVEGMEGTEGMEGMEEEVLMEPGRMYKWREFRRHSASVLPDKRS
jgi:hypothetical protein